MDGFLSLPPSLPPRLDLTDLESVRAFAAGFKAKYPTLDVLVNNAAIELPKIVRTDSGKEMMMATNHIGHVLLTELLLETLKATSSSRIVHVSSVAASQMTMGMNSMADVDLSDPYWESKKFDEWLCYGSSKLAQAMYSEELAKRLESEGSGVKSVALHPGWCATPLFRNQLCCLLCCILPTCGPCMGTLNLDEASQVHLHTILSPDIVSGKFYSQKGIYTRPELQAGALPYEVEFNPNNTAEKRAAVYEWSLKECGLQQGGAPAATVSDDDGAVSGVGAMAMARDVRYGF